MAESDNFEIQIAFRVTGQGRVGADGIGVWYTAQQPVLGPVSCPFLSCACFFASVEFHQMVVVQWYVSPLSRQNDLGSSVGAETNLSTIRSTVIGTGVRIILVTQTPRKRELSISLPAGDC